MSETTATEAPAETAPAAGQPHPYHLVDPSPWPLLGATAAGMMALGGVVFLHGGGAWLLIVGALSVAMVMAVWWRDIIIEAFVQRAHSAITKLGLRYGMILFIASEVMFFSAFFWAYFDAWLFPKAATGFVWPPEGIHFVGPIPLPFLMTMVLLLSGCTVTFAHHALQQGHQKEAVTQLAVTVGLGVLFTALQAYEYVHASFGFGDGIYPSAFYMATGFHGFHVLIGTVFLAVCWWRMAKGHFTPDSHFGFEAAAWYWHFVDVVWLFLFSFIYFFSTLGAPGGGN